MKQLTCEMCGSTDLVKQDGVFVCQTCGCKYSVEEAKKMMIEGTVDVSGSEVKIDRSEQIEKIRKLAARAKEASDTAAAAKYYEQIMLEDPDDWEATFYTTLYSASNCKVAQIGEAALRVGNIIDPVFQLIQQQYEEEVAKVQADDARSEEDKRLAIVSLNVDRMKNYNSIVTECLNFGIMLTNNITSNMTNPNTVNKNIEDWLVPVHMSYIMLGDALLKHFGDAKLAKEQYAYAIILSNMLNRVPSGRQLLQVARIRLKSADGYVARKESEEREKEREKAREKYWNEHSEEKEKLDAEKQQLTEEKARVEDAIKPYNERIKELLSQNKEKLPLEDEHHDLQNKVRDLESGFAKLGVFKSKERKRLQEQYSEEKEKLRALEQEIKKQKEERARDIDEQIAAISKEMEPLNQRLKELKDRIDWIDKELTKDR